MLCFQIPGDNRTTPCFGESAYAEKQDSCALPVGSNVRAACKRRYFHRNTAGIYAAGAGKSVLFLFLYALKSATIFFPLIFLEVASGYLFPTWMALLLNFTGILLILTIPYWMGKALGLEIVQKAAQRYPSSPIFWISALLTVTLSVLSAALYYVYQRSSSRSSSTEDQKKGDER